MTASAPGLPPRSVPEGHTDPAARARRQPAVRRALTLVLALNVVVVAAKVVVGWKTGALTVLGSAVESGLDFLNLALGMILVAVAARGPDEDHPYGHEKFESLGTLAIVGFLSISCFELLRQSVVQLARGGTPRPPTVADGAILIATAGVNAFIVWYERSRGRALGSTYLTADAAHTTSDLYVTVLAVVSLVLTGAGAGFLDAPLAILVALLIARNGYLILKGSVPVLVDQRAVDAVRIRQLVSGVPRVADVRAVRSRGTPSGLLFVDVTIGVEGSTSVVDAHAIADAVEARIEDALGAAEVTVHVEPA